jgi:hypothetical protein
MKKIALALLATSVLSSACYARGELVDSLTCGYSDYFHLGKDSATVSIVSASSDVGINVTKNNDNSFTLSDVPSCPHEGGWAKVRYQATKSDYCDLEIHDAAYDFGPELKSTCAGKLQYNGKSSDSYFSHSYSLAFTLNK